MSGPHTRFYRDKQAGKISGVAAGISDYFGTDASLVRIGIIASLFVAGPFILLAYLLMAWITPAKPRQIEEEEERNPDEKKFWQDVRKNPRRSARAVRARFREIDRRMADVEAYLTSPDRRLAREIDSLR
jgi:phage shock protein C